ncbi:MAG TPA: flagellar motor switch protein FliM [Clostridiaceae bacterium]|jgi:flagellar motor switch protein FliM|nr:flagellar motor switch protein FliM [Clostridiaceae bacterium]HOA31544.1 flagellar motor switch protein FliM [Clostridia bacterium]
MANVLSQSEIDELLKSLNAGIFPVDKESKPEMRVKKYNFRLANKFTKEQLRTISNIFESYSRFLTNFFTGTLRTSCEIDLVSIEETKYIEFANSLPNVSFLGVIGLSPLAGSSLISISTELAYVMINRVLGGAITDEEPELYFTEIEIVIMEKLFRQMLQLLDEAWQKVVEVDSSLERIETNPQYAQIAATNEQIAIVTMNVKISNVEGFIHFCLPHLAIKPIEKLLSVKSMYNVYGEQKSDEMSEQIKDLIDTTKLNLVARFNNTYSCVKDVMDIQEGDVIVLDHRVDNPINLYVEHLPKFKGKLGVKDRRYSIMINDIEYEEDNIDEWDFISSGN